MQWSWPIFIYCSFGASRIWWYSHGSRKRGVAVSEKLILTLRDEKKDSQ